MAGMTIPLYTPFRYHGLYLLRDVNVLCHDVWCHDVRCHAEIICRAAGFLSTYL